MSGINRSFGAALAILTIWSCGEPTADSAALVGSSTTVSDNLVSQRVSLLDRLGRTSRLLETFSRGRDRDDDAAALHEVHGKYIGQFWDAWHSTHLNASASSTNQAPDPDLRARVDVSSEMELLRILFEDPMPARSRTLLYVLGDTLVSLVDRLAASVTLYDFSCKLTDCFHDQERNEFIELIQLIGAIPDAQKLRQLLEPGSDLSIQHLRPEWRDIFVAVADPAHHDIFEQAVLTATGDTKYTPGVVTHVQGVPASLTTLTPVLLRCQRWVDNFEHLGYFENDSLPRLRVPLNHEQLGQWLQEVGHQRAELAAELSRFKEEQRANVASGVNSGQHEKEKIAIASKLQQTRMQMGHLVSDLHAIRGAITRTEIAQTFAQDLDALLKRGNIDSSASSQVGASIRANISASHAQAGQGKAIETWAVPDHVAPPFRANNGDIVTLTVTGTWSPTCALRKAGRSGAALARIGPEGFDEQIVDGSVQTSAVHSGRDVSTSLTALVASDQSVEVFAQAGASFYGNEAGVRASARLSTHIEAAGQSAFRRSDYDISATEKRNSAAFSVGMRLPTTPFPTFPVGSLLLVQVPDDKPLEPRIDVVRPQMSVIVPHASTLYFVVNDLVEDCEIQGGTLDVHGRVVETLGGSAERLTSAIVGALEELDAQLGAMVEGVASPMVAASLRSTTLAKLNRDGVRLEQLPPEMFTLFNSFLEKSLANWERKAIILNRQRDLQALILEEAALQAELELNDGQRRLNALALSWSEKNVDVEVLRWRTTRLIRFVSDTLIPALQILYPERVAAYRQQTQPLAAHLSLLRALPFDHDFSTLTKSVLEIVATCEADLRSEEAVSRTRGRTGVALVFERPGRKTSFAGPRADVARSAALWDAVDRGTEVTVAIHPADLYNPHFDAPESLRCTHCTPVVRFMGGYFVLPGGGTDPRVFNSSSRPLSVVVNSDVLFATPRKPLQYTFSGATITIPIKLGDDTQVRSESIWRETSGMAVNDGLGLSPFSIFTLNLNHSNAENSEFSRVQADLTAFVLLVDLETQHCPIDSLQWLPVCQ